jgi:hypothetical protein
MSTPEAKVKDFIDKRMKQWFPNAFKYSPPGTRFGKAGMADRIWFVRATDTTCIVVAIEAKAEGNEITPIQLHTLVKLKEQGCVVAVVIGKDEEKMGLIRDEVIRRISMANA